MNSRTDESVIADEAGTAVQVRPFTADDAARWEEFVARCPDATFFHRIGWKDLLERCFRHKTHYLMAERDARVVGVLPLAEVKTLLFGHALVSLPFCAVAALHRAAKDLGARIGVEHLELRNRLPREPEWPRQGLYAAFRREISADAEENMRAIPRKQRAMVRKGIKNGLTSRIDGDVSGFFSPRSRRFCAAKRPNSSKRVFSGCSSRWNRARRCRTSRRKRSASARYWKHTTTSSAKRIIVM